MIQPYCIKNFHFKNESFEVEVKFLIQQKVEKTMLMIKYIFKFNTYNALLRLCLQQIDGVYY